MRDDHASDSRVKAKAFVKSRKFLLPFGVSLLFVVFLLQAFDWRQSLEILHMDMSSRRLMGFVLMAFLIVWIYGYRWNLLLDGRLSGKSYLIASLLCIGGNMFLPARGGDLLRVHYSHIEGHISHAVALSRLIIEKIIDLITIIMAGALAVFLLSRSKEGVNNYLIDAAMVTVAVTVLGVISIKYFSDLLLKCMRRVLRFIKKSESLERHITHLIKDAAQRLTFSLTVRPGVLTLAMWLAVYAPSYMLIAHMVGVSLDYREALVVLFAAALGLMIPAAPSGIGTFHASVVSAFLFLGRPATEGLLVGTAIHLLYLIVYALPAAVMYGSWHFKRKSSY
jgi:uncharacterized membrane protein YbhN (UPF0104 family)